MDGRKCHRCFYSGHGHVTSGGVLVWCVYHQGAGRPSCGSVGSTSGLCGPAPVSVTQYGSGEVQLFITADDKPWYCFWVSLVVLQGLFSCLGGRGGTCPQGQLMLDGVYFIGNDVWMDFYGSNNIKINVRTSFSTGTLNWSQTIKAINLNCQYF